MKLHLGASVQYISGAEAGIFVPLVEKILPLAPASGKLTTLDQTFHSARQNEVVALLRPTGNAVSPADANTALARATAKLRALEADGSYERAAHAALEIAKRSAYFMNYAGEQGNAAYARNLAPTVVALSNNVVFRAASEPKWYPGVMVRVALDTSAIRKNTPPTQPLDEKFDPQVSKKAGDSVELEITVYNWTKTGLKGSVSPSLPDGWKADHAAFDYAVAPMKFARFSALVAVPASAGAGIYKLGAQTTFKGAVQHEIHAHRVLIP